MPARCGGVNNTAAKQPGVVGNTPALRASVGVGLAWDSPIGALRADYAIPVVKQPYDKTQALQLRPDAVLSEATLQAKIAGEASISRERINRL